MLSRLDFSSHLRHTISCKMGPKTCVAANFTSVITDHGVCFTFNTVLDEGGITDPVKLQDEKIPIEVHDTG